MAAAAATLLLAAGFDLGNNTASGVVGEKREGRERQEEE